MTPLSALVEPDRGQDAHILEAVETSSFEAWLSAQPERVRTAITAHRLTATIGASAILPGETMQGWSAVIVVADGALDPWCIARLAEALPDGIYRLQGREAGAAMLGWMLGQHRFERYRREEKPVGPRILLSGEPARIDDAIRLAEATALVRDLVNTGASDLGPAELQSEAEALAARIGARIIVTTGAELEAGYPMIHAVGQAATLARAPRLIELEWGDPAHPRVAIVGKGVCFDSGGLDIKPASGMRLMKKDMGGAAHGLALAGLIAGAKLPIRLHLLIPAVENAISAAAFRPGDILRSRKGLSVEVGNTDAEGRLVLADAITRAAEAEPALIIDFATLTGAARVALGPDLPALFSNTDSLASALLSAGTAVEDPLWRLPLWPGYRELIASDIADLSNAPDGGFAGAITAALFLERFVPDATEWAHIDTFAWRPTAKPGRPKGGEALGLRAVFQMLKARFG